MTKSKCLRRSDVRQDGVESALDAEDGDGCEKEQHVEAENHVADLQQVGALADEQRGDLRAVEHRAAAHGQTDAGADEEAAEDGGEHQVVCHVWIGDERKRDGQPDDRQQTAQGKGGANVTIADGDERQVDHREPEGEREGRDLREEHRDAGDAAVDEVAREQESVEAHAGRQDAERDQEDVQELANQWRQDVTTPSCNLMRTSSA